MNNYLKSLTPLNRFAVWNSMISFVLGSILLVLFIITEDKDLIEIGMGYLILAFYWNVIVLLLVILVAVGRKTPVKQSLSTVGILLVNIPIAFLYFYIVVEIV